MRCPKANERFQTPHKISTMEPDLTPSRF
ncbi:hypothetical protein LINPERPRIM_LOCUS22389 [Linum perenne]